MIRGARLYGVSPFRYDWKVTNRSVSGDIEFPDSGPELRWLFETVGRYAVQVTVIDSLGRESWPDVLEILVTDPPETPPPSDFPAPFLVAITSPVNPANLTVGQAVTFTAVVTASVAGGASVDDVLVILWDFPDGSFAGSGPDKLSVPHTFLFPGSGVVFLDITDRWGRITFLEIQIVVR